MTIENKGLDSIFLPKRDLNDQKLVELFEGLGYEVRERPPHPLVRAVRRLLSFKVQS